MIVPLFSANIKHNGGRIYIIYCTTFNTLVHHLHEFFFYNNSQTPFNEQSEIKNLNGDDTIIP